MIVIHLSITKLVIYFFLKLHKIFYHFLSFNNVESIDTVCLSLYSASFPLHPWDESNSANNFKMSQILNLVKPTLNPTTCDPLLRTWNLTRIKSNAHNSEFGKKKERIKIKQQRKRETKKSVAEDEFVRRIRYRSLSIRFRFLRSLDLRIFSQFSDSLSLLFHFNYCLLW